VPDELILLPRFLDRKNGRQRIDRKFHECSRFPHRFESIRRNDRDRFSDKGDLVVRQYGLILENRSPSIVMEVFGREKADTWDFERFFRVNAADFSARDGTIDDAYMKLSRLEGTIVHEIRGTRHVTE